MDNNKHLRIDSYREPPPENAEPDMEKYEIEAQNLQIAREIQELEFEKQEQEDAETPDNAGDGETSSPSPVDDTGEMSGPSNNININMEVYKLDMKNPGEVYEN